jgi:hypothetical protein
MHGPHPLPCEDENVPPLAKLNADNVRSTSGRPQAGQRTASSRDMTSSSNSLVQAGHRYS